MATVMKKLSTDCLPCSMRMGMRIMHFYPIKIMIDFTICDRSGEIDFDEMVDGLAKLAPSALITHPKTFYDVIKLDGTDEVSRLELLRIFMMLERAPQKDCLNDVSQVFDVLNLESNRGLSCWCFCDGVRSDVKLRNVFTKYLTIEGNQKLRLHTVD